MPLIDDHSGECEVRSTPYPPGQVPIRDLERTLQRSWSVRFRDRVKPGRVERKRWSAYGCTTPVRTELVASDVAWHHIRELELRLCGSIDAIP